MVELPRIISLPHFDESRGVLTALDLQGGVLPFEACRAFWITGIPQESTRGSHAHHTCAEIIVAAAGSFEVETLTLQGESRTFLLSSPSEALYIPALTWCELRKFTPQSVCLCFCPEPYSPQGYISTKADFLALQK